MNIQEIKLTKPFCVIFSDNHTNLSNIRKLKELYPNELLISLGDLTFLYAKPGEKWNSLSIQYFIDNKIPVVLGNHDQYVLHETKFIHDITTEQFKFLKNLPIGIKLVLPNNKYYLLFHHLPDDLWSHKREGDLSESEFLDRYPINDNVLDVIHGHIHENFIDEYPYISQRRISLGRLCHGDHHKNNDDSGGNYLLITEKGIEFKKI